MGHYFKLEAYEPLVHQLLRSLKKLEANFIPETQFERHLQLFRLVAAPGMGKTTAMFEIWRLLAHAAWSELDGQHPVEARLLERIGSSLAEGCMMVFLLDLSHTDMSAKDALEDGVDKDGVLALRMLWASVRASGRWQSYSRFLQAMPVQLRRNISSVVVLRFWGAAACFSPGVRWLAVFEVDEVNAAIPQTWPRLPMECPDKVADILEWAGGMPRRIAWGLSAMSGAVPMDEERLLTGPDDWGWLTGNFRFTAAIGHMLAGMGSSDQWCSWFRGDKAALLNQLFTHAIMRFPVARAAPAATVRAAGKI
ncbi:hypothetical protein WJX72_001494 [[Myrmecia] bisecta]|uniref:Uncharacterized protein n=1 Tax=[Myrmecia] bisecta TaxID=41462 RepID=A0AAW1R4F7_9CHLO